MAWLLSFGSKDSPVNLKKINRRLDNLRNIFAGHDEAALRSFHKRFDSRLGGRLACAYNKYLDRIPEYRDIPVIINNFNRLEWLIQLLAWLKKAGMNRVVIIDNGSSYPPLLDYYSKISQEVVHGKNLGPLALWGTRDLWQRVRNNFFVYTDVDVVPDDHCPLDVIDFLLQSMLTHPDLEKIGLGLRIDDLPDCYEKKADVLAWERRHWNERFGPGYFKAKVDTTFALYRPRAMGGWWLKSLRTDFPYVARHLPWYQDSDHPSEEDLFYIRNIKHGISSWTEGRGYLGPRVDV